jgi:phosphoribosylglycinamide formyltransferase 1
MENIAIFASGSGSNAQRIIEYFRDSHDIHVVAVLTNNPNAFVIQRCRKLNVPCILFSRTEFYETGRIVEILEEQKISFIVLAGFLWLVPQNLLKIYPGKILNIHPALLPKYGGKGMYGMKVHSAVLESGDPESGISIHLVNEHYDEGNILFQAMCKIEPGETPESLAAKVHSLEYNFYPKVIEEVVKGFGQQATSFRQ